MTSTDWREAFVVDGVDPVTAGVTAGAAPPVAPGGAETASPPPAVETTVDASEEDAKRRKGFFKRLRKNLTKSRQALMGELRASFGDPLDTETWERLEEALIFADAGAKTTAAVVGRLEDEALEGKIKTGEELAERLRGEIASALRTSDHRIDIAHSPAVILVVGVNGTGKTTTIGKLAWHLKHEMGRSVLVAAGDTFRAAAQEQLGVWAERAGADFVTSDPGSDPGSVVFDGIAAARARRHDVIIADTAGRLHTQFNLMEELVKVRRVIERQVPDAPHETLLVVDATTGQNGLRQAKMFRDAVDVTGVCLTKLDGTAKGGIALAIAHEVGIPVKLIGIGEAIEDLRPFDPDDFAAALVG